MKFFALVPSRFLMLVCHLIALITLLQTRTANVKAGLPVDHTKTEFTVRDNQYIGGLVAGIVLTTFELVGFVTGLSMFAALTSIISTLCHASATFCFLVMLVQQWDAQLYWVVFGFCSVIPAVFELLNLVSFVFKKNL